MAERVRVTGGNIGGVNNEGIDAQVTNENRLETAAGLYVWDGIGWSKAGSSNSVPVNLYDEDGNKVSVQYPLSTDGDSVYCKDVWVDESITTDWVDTDSAGIDIACIPFTNLHTRITNSTTDNPKILLIHFERTVGAYQVGIGCTGGGNFSNVTIKLLGSGGALRTVVDDSANNTKYTSNNYPFEPELFNAVQLEFSTVDAVCLSNITIQKSRNVAAQIQGLKADGTIDTVSLTNGSNLKVSLEELENDISVNGNTQLKVTPYDSSGNEITSQTSQLQFYRPEADSWTNATTSRIGVHLCASNVSTTTGYVMVDKSDTTNYPHSNTNLLWLTGYQISINPDVQYRGQVLIGYVDDIDATDAYFHPVLCWFFDRASSQVTDSMAVSPTPASSDTWLVPGSPADTTFNTSTALTSPSGTSTPGNGDMVMKITVTSGSVSVGITLKYFST